MRLISLLAGLLVGAIPAFSSESAPGFRVPDGFVIESFAGPELANDIYTLHIDSDGRIVVAGRGYIRQLIEIDGKVKAVDLVSNVQGGAMGLLWEGETLYAVVDGGLKKWIGVAGAATQNEKPKTVFGVLTTGEHHAHAVKRGPDGLLYSMCGNSSGIGAKHVTDETSPIREPVAGCWLRIDEKAGKVAVMADGFRNAYDFDFTSTGRAITFDSDNERCVGLPWFEPTRLYHIRHGGHYGWLNPQHTQMWRKPPDYPDVVAPILTAGRGSPTGVTCYRHTAFPKKFHDGVFFADWTFGKIEFSGLQPEGETLAGKREDFLISTGESGFAPTGLAVHPKSGDLYVSSGGRGTRGAVYRIRVKAPTPNAKSIPWNVSPEHALMEFDATVTENDWKKACTPAERFSVLRKYQISLGDFGAPAAMGTAYEGYTFRKPVKDPIWASLVAAYPTRDEKLDREMVRTFAAFELDDERVTSHVVNGITRTEDPLVQAHGIIAMGRLRAPLRKTEPGRFAMGIVLLDKQYEKKEIVRDRNWPLRMQEALAAILKRHPDVAGLIAQSTLYGTPAHLWIAQTPGIDRKASAEAFVRQSQKTNDYDWQPGQLEFLTELRPQDRRAIFERLLKRGTLDEALVSVLARNALPADGPLFRKYLGSANAKTVLACLQGLTAQRVEPTAADLANAIRALRRFAEIKTDVEIRKALVDWMIEKTEQTHGESVAAWEKWFSEKYPESANLLASAGYDSAAWKKKLDNVKWDAGDAVNGKKLFAKAQCISCHNGGQASGPSLEGVAKRFSRDDVFTAILDPNRDISPRYRTTRINTKDGKTYEGISIYDAPDGVILQIGVDTNVRIAGNNIESTSAGTLSLMPSGLLDTFTLGEIADLYAFLKSLEARK